MAEAQAEPEKFDEPTGDLPDHYAAIGRLITAFSNIERALNEVIRAVIGQNVGAGLSEEMSRALTGEMRATDLISHLRRVLEARERDAVIAGAQAPPKPSAMDPLFLEIGALKLVRDRVAHHRFFVSGREMIFTNADTARNSLSVQFNLYLVEELNEMAEYAGRLTERLYLLRPALFLASLAEAMTRNPALLQIPALLRNATQNRKARRERPRQRGSSPE